MPLCPHCGRTNGLSARYCSSCGKRLSLADPLSRDAERARLAYLIGEVESWVEQGRMSADESAGILPSYRERLTALHLPVPAPPAPTAPLFAPPAANAPLFPVSPPSATPPPSAPDGRATLESFLEERNIFWWHIVSALLLVSGLIGLAWWQWSSVGRYVVAALFLAVTGGLYRVGTVTHEKLPENGRVLIVLALLLVPVNIVFINANSLLGLRLERNAFGLLTSLASTALYAVMLRRWKYESLMYLATLAALAVLHFAMRILRLAPADEALAALPIALGLLYTSARVQPHELPLKRPLLSVAQGSVALSLLASVVLAQQFYADEGLLRGALLMLLSAAFCGCYAECEREARAPYAAGMLAASSAVLFVLGLKAPLDTGLGLAALALGATLIAVARHYQQEGEEQQALAEGYFHSGIAASAGAVLVLFSQGGKYLGEGGLPNETTALARLVGTTTLAAGFYAALTHWLRQPRYAVVAIGLFTYGWFVAARLGTVLLERPPLNHGIVLFPLALGGIAYGIAGRHRSAIIGRGSLAWGTGLALMSLFVQVLEHGYGDSASPLPASEFGHLIGLGRLSVIAALGLHAALIAALAEELARQAMTSADDAPSRAFIATAREASPWLALIVGTALSVAAGLSVTRLHWDLAAGSLVMLGVASALLAAALFAELGRQPWWSRPMLIMAGVIALVFALLPQSHGHSRDSHSAIASLSVGLVLCFAVTVFHCLRIAPATFDERVPAGRWLRTGNDSLILAWWLIVSVAAVVVVGVASTMVLALHLSTAALGLLAFQFRTERFVIPASAVTLIAAWFSCATTGFDNDTSSLLAPVLALGGGGYLWFAHRREHANLALLAAACLAVSHAHALEALRVQNELYPLLAMPLVVAFVYWTERVPHLAHSFRTVAGLVTMAAVGHAVITHDRAVLQTTLVVFGLLYLVSGTRNHSKHEAVIGGALLSSGWAYALTDRQLGWQPFLFRCSWLGPAWLGVMAVSSRIERLQPLRQAFVALAAVPAGVTAALAMVIISQDRADGSFAVFTLLIGSLTFGLLAAVLRQAAYGHASFLCLLAAYYLPLLDNRIKAPDVYLIPIGLYLIALSLLAERLHTASSATDDRVVDQTLAGLGLVIALGSSLWSSMTLHASPWHDVVLTTEAVAAFVFGMGQRRRVFVVEGVAFLLALGMVKAWGILISIHWAIYVTTLGLGGLAAGHFFSIKRHELLALSDRIKAGLGSWQ